MNGLEWLIESVGGVRGARATVARVYRQALQGEGVSVADLPDLNNPESENALAELFAAEARLLAQVPDSALRSRLWSMLDRFDRIVPEATRTRYWQVVPALADAVWHDPAFLRGQLDALLRQIHRSHLIKQAREEETVRLRAMVFAIVGSIALAFGLGVLLALGRGKLLSLGFGYFMFCMAGILGAAVSYMRRLQAAMDHDVAASDGLAELQALRGSRISAVSSMVLGGIFAVLVYWLSIAGLFTSLIPESAGESSLASAQRAAAEDVSARQAEVARLLAADPPSGQGAENGEPSAAPDAGPAADPATPTAPNPAAEDALAAAKAALAAARTRQAVLDNAAAVQPAIANCPAPAGDDLVSSNRRTACSVGASYARLLGLADARSFYLMLVLTFLAGFGEQLVPDKLKQLSQRFSGQGSVG